MKYLGIDFGLKKIGLAISEGTLASPYKVLHVKNQTDALVKTEDILKQENISQVVIGLPESGVRTAVLKFIAKLKLKIPVETADETLSSKQATFEMIELGMKKKKRMEEDAYSAASILQGYLDSRNLSS